VLVSVFSPAFNLFRCFISGKREPTGELALHQRAKLWSPFRKRSMIGNYSFNKRTLVSDPLGLASARSQPAFNRLRQRLSIRGKEGQEIRLVQDFDFLR